MKHSLKVTIILLGMFLIAQLIGLIVISSYSPVTEQISLNGTLVNITHNNLPYGLEPPPDMNPQMSLVSIIISIIIAVAVMFLLMKYGATTFLRFWFFFVVVLALGISINGLTKGIVYSSIISLIVALPLSYLKIFKRNIFVHNITELFIYPGIASIFVPLLNVWTIILLLIFISIYDMYAVWHAGFMQKMAKYQINTLQIFSGFFVPYLGKKERNIISQNRKLKSESKMKKVKLNVAILGGGDVVFPMILAGVVMRAMGLIPALIIIVGATLALSFLFYISEKGKFYPAMPFITAGSFIALGMAYLLQSLHYI